MRRIQSIVCATVAVALLGCGGASSRVYFDGTGKSVIDADQYVVLDAHSTGSGSVSYSLSGPGRVSVSHTILGDVEVYYPPSDLTATATATVTASSGGASATYSITINPALSFPVQTLPAFSVGKPYSSNLSATQGTGNLSFSVISGNLPSGIALSQTGTLSGTPTAMGNYSFTVEVKDQADTPAYYRRMFTGTVS